MSIYEQICDDALQRLERGERLDQLVYLANPADVADLFHPGATKGKVNAVAGYVEVIAGPSCPRGTVHACWRCKCGALFTDNRSRLGKCEACLMRRAAGLSRMLKDMPRIHKEVTPHLDFQGERLAWPAPMTTAPAPNEPQKLCPLCGKLRPFSTVVMSGTSVEVIGCECVSSKCMMMAPAVDPLDVEYDGVTLRDLLYLDADWRLEMRFIGPGGPGRMLSPAQRAAISAHWSAELRAKVAAAREHERCQLVLDVEDWP